MAGFSNSLAEAELLQINCFPTFFYILLSGIPCLCLVPDGGFCVTGQPVLAGLFVETGFSFGILRDFLVKNAD